jgi:hypothetical protein
MTQSAFPITRRVQVLLPPGSRFTQYRAELRRLIEFDGSRCLSRIALGAILFVSPPTLAISAFVGAVYLAGDNHSLARVVLGGAVAFGLGQALTAYAWRHRPWNKLIDSKLASYEEIDGHADINAVIRQDDARSVYRALRRAKLVPVGGTLIPPLPNAPDLSLKLTIGRSSRWHPNAPELYVQIIDCLRVAGIRAQVGREQILP